MLLIDEGLVALDDPIARWLPELAAPRVVRNPASPLDDVIPAARPITVEDLLTFRAGWGFASDFSLPAIVALFERLPVFGPHQGPDEWLATLASVPMLRQPGEAWLHNTCSAGESSPSYGLRLPPIAHWCAILPFASSWYTTMPPPTSQLRASAT